MEMKIDPNECFVDFNEFLQRTPDLPSVFGGFRLCSYLPYLSLFSHQPGLGFDVIQPNRNIDREQISLSLPCPQTPRSALIRIIVGPVPAVSPLAVWWRLDPVAVWPHISQLTLAPWAGCGLPIRAMASLPANQLSLDLTMPPSGLISTTTRHQ